MPCSLQKPISEVENVFLPKSTMESTWLATTLARSSPPMEMQMFSFLWYR